MEAGVDAGQVKRGRFEVRPVFEAEPLKPFLVLLVGRVCEHAGRMPVRVGVDIVSVDSVRRSIQNHAERYLERVYTERELQSRLAILGVPRERWAIRCAPSGSIGTPRISADRRSGCGS